MSLDISLSDIARLSDASLRSLVVRLCEAELRAAALPTVHLTAGGAQDAPDGGIDVRVAAPATLGASGWIPRGDTGFQVKTTAMSPSALRAEMRPSTALRPSIADLLASGGAYVIVSAQTSPTDSELRRRLAAMREAAGNGATATGVLDFYGGDRLALWCRSHPGVLTWARQAAGRPVQGWRPFENWSNPAETAEAAFLLDEEARLVDERSPGEGAVPLQEGLGRLRERVNVPRSATRLVGLSGVGKTRLLQAIFDERIGTDPPPRDLALYCDFAQPTTPNPAEMARYLVDRGDRVVLLIDNCSPETHRSLATICLEPASKVSLITVEYDVRDDVPEGSEVFRLDPASSETTAALIGRRFPQISQPDRRTIAELSGGNARIALVLANTLRPGETLGTLRDAALFDRLFLQRNSADPSLLSTAEVCSLVYSFDGESDASGAELLLLAELAGESPAAVQANVVELMRRELTQKRGRWRAVLPHALANRLAARSLERFSTDQLVRAFGRDGYERLLKSFTRRLGYLHDLEPARRIAEAWFGPGGRLADFDTLDDARFEQFRNLAPAAPVAALNAINRVAANNSDWASLPERVGADRTHSEVARLVRALAYDRDTFPAASARLVELALAGPADDNRHTAREAFKSLFGLYFSGTLALPEDRLAVVRDLVSAGEPRVRELGLTALGRMLETSFYGSLDGFDFGTRPRSFGWRPTGEADLRRWYEPAIQAAAALATKGDDFAPRAGALLARRFRGLWTSPLADDALEKAMLQVVGAGFWASGWIAVRNTLRLEPGDPFRDRLLALEKRLRPGDLVERARAYTFSQTYGALDIADGEEVEDGAEADSTFRRVERLTEELGAEVAQDRNARAELLDDLIRVWSPRGFNFATGLARGAPDPQELWAELVAAVVRATSAQAEPNALRAYLQEWRQTDQATVDEIIKFALDDPVLGQWFPVLQCAAPLDEPAVERLLSSLELGLAPALAYRILMFGGVADRVPAEPFSRLVLGVAAKPNGFEIALDIFHMRLHSERKKETALDRVLSSCGRSLLLLHRYDAPDNNMLDYHLAEIAEVSLVGAESAAAAERLLRKLKVAFKRTEAFGYHYDNLIRQIFKSQPEAALDFFLVRQARPHQGRYARTLIHSFDFRMQGVSQLTPEVLVAWAGRNPATRFSQLAEVIPLFEVTEDGDDGAVWWPGALALLEAAPDRAAVLERYAGNMHPRSWSGSRADVLEKRRRALQPLKAHTDPVVATWAREAGQAHVELDHRRARPG